MNINPKPLTRGCLIEPLHSFTLRRGRRSRLGMAIFAVFVLAVLSTRATAQSGGSTFPRNGRTGTPNAIRPSQPATAVPAPSRRIPSPTTPITSDGSKDSASGSTFSIFKTLAALLLVVTLILICAKFLRKHSPVLKLGLPKDAVEVLGRTSLDPKQHVYLVRLGAQILVLGSSAGELRTLANITDPMQVDLLAGSCKQQAGQHQSHGLADLFRRFTAPTAPEVQPPPNVKPVESADSEFHRKLQDRFTVPATSRSVD